MSTSKFDWYDQPQLIVAIAKTNSGKTHAIKNIICDLYARNIIKDVIVMSSTLFSGDYDFVTDSKKKFNSISVDAIKALVAHRSRLKSEGKELKGCALILDDVVGDSEVRSKILDKIAAMSRHVKLHVFFITQYAKLLSPTIRANIGVVMIFHQPNKESLQTLYEICSMTPTKVQFGQYLDKYVHSYHYLAYNAKEVSNDFHKKYQLQIADKTIPHFQI